MNFNTQLPVVITNIDFHRHLIQKQKDPSKAHQVKMDVVVKALKWLQIDMDIDEV